MNINDTNRQDLEASELIRARRIEGTNVTAFNFTRDAFFRGEWDNLSVHARGLFLNDEDKVVQRGFTKFFNLGERPETQRDAVLANSAYPVRALHKLNGFLGLVSAQGGNELHCYTKGGPTAFAGLLDEILLVHLRNQGDDAVSQFTAAIRDADVTVAFEVISFDRDAHIADEGDEDRLVLLAAIRNQMEFSTDEELAASLASRFGFDVPALLGMADNVDELDALISVAQASNTEGAVFIDANDFYFKVKSDSYSGWKDLRRILNKAFVVSRRQDGADVALFDNGIDPRTDYAKALMGRVRAAGFETVSDLAPFMGQDISGMAQLNLVALRRFIEAQSRD